MAVSTVIPALAVVQGDMTYALRVPTWIDNYTISSAAAVSVSIPTEAKFAIMSCTGNFYAQYNSATSAIVPTSAVTNSGCELNPAVRWVGNSTGFSVISPTTNTLTIAWFRP